MTERTPDEYDWDDALFNDRRLSKHFTSPRRAPIRTVTLHHMTILAPGDGSDSTVALEGCYRTWQNRQASANYGVSGDQVWQYVSDNDAAWANASSSNHETLSIEHANSTAGPSWKVSDKTMQTGARLVATLHRLYGLGRPSRKTVKMHRDYYATACPGPYMVDHLDEYIAAAARFYDNPQDNPKENDMPLTDADVKKIVTALKKDLFSADVVKIEDPVGTPESRKANPTWAIKSVLGVLLREVVRTRDMVAQLLEEKAGPTGKA